MGGQVQKHGELEKSKENKKEGKTKLNIKLKFNILVKSVHKTKHTKFNTQCLGNVTSRFDVSQVFCQWEMIVHICTESIENREQLKTK